MPREGQQNSGTIQIPKSSNSVKVNFHAAFGDAIRFGNVLAWGHCKFERCQKFVLAEEWMVVTCRYLMLLVGCAMVLCVWLTALLISLLHLNRLIGYVGEYYYLKTVAFMVYHNFLLNVWPAGVATSRSSWQTHVLSMLRLMLSSKHINHSQLLITWAVPPNK